MLIHRLALNFIKYYPFDYSSQRTIIGLAAGFDKNCEVVSHIHKLGFAFAEVGSLTVKPNKGRNGDIIKFDSSMINNLGLPNIGIDKAREKLQNVKPKIPILVNISPLPEDTIKDIQDALFKIENYCSGIVLNLSCPNIGRCKEKIDLSKLKSKKPIFIKLSPDLDHYQIEEIVKEAVENNIKGYILTNSLPVQRGGLSGRRIKEYSNNSINIVNKLKKKDQLIIGCGGIETAEDILEKLDLGANYVEILTSWLLSKNPLFINNLNKELKDKELKDKELKDKELKDKELKDKELKEKELKEKELKEKLNLGYGLVGL